MSRSLAFVYSLVLTAVMVGATGGLTPVAAQGLTGQITGTITDSGGGVLPGATVVATNTATQATRQAVTNAEGVYVVPDLLAGSYNLTVTMSGFKTYQQTGVTVGATDRVVLRDIVLEVGGFEETVSVTADATRVETTTAARSGTVARDTIDEIAAKGRDFTAYLRLLPGVIDTASRETPGAPGGGLQINGRTSFNFTMDGITQKDTGANGGGYTAPSLDSIAEVRVQTSNFQAEYGRSSGASINVVTRSGSQSFRGSVAYYKRNDALNSNEYQRRRNCQNGLTAQCDAAPYNYDNTAWTFGGPLLIPGTSFNENRDKLFFFFSQDLLPRKTPGNTVTERVPTLLERQGNFSQTFDSQGRLVNIRDASTGLPCTVTSGGAGCFAGNVIPANRLDPLGQAYLNLMPLPNTTDPNGTNRYNFSVQARDDLLRTDQILRVDWNVSPKATFYSRLQFGYDRTTGNIVAQNWPIYPRKWEVLTRGIVNTFLYSFSPTTFMEITQGLNWAHQDESPLDQAAQDRNDRRLLPGYQPFFADANPMNVIPNASFSGGLPQNPSQFSVGNRFPFEAYNRIWNTSSNLTKVVGEHTIKAGVFWEYTQRPAPNGTNFNGAFSFNADGENPCNTNVGLANALLGCVTQYTESNQRPYGHGVFNNVEWYVQDNWRVAPNVTLDYGLRFYSVGATRSEGDKVAQFEPSAWNAAAAPRVYIRSGGRALDPATGALLPPSFIGLQVPGTGEPYNGMVVYDEQVMDTAPIQVGPRVGVAWDVTGDGRTAVRAGWGMFFDRFPDHEFINLTTQPPVTVTNSLFYTTTSGLQTATLLTSPPNVSNWPQLDPPKTHNWSAGVQRELGYSMVADVSYVGSASSNQLSAGGSGAPSYQIPLNGRTYGYRFLPENLDPTNVISGVMQPYAENQANQLRPMVGLGNVTMYSQIGESIFHSLQISLNKRRGAAGLSYGIAYTYQFVNQALRSLDPFIADIPAGHPHSNNNDLRNTNEAGKRPHFLTINYSYQVPNLSSAWDTPVAKVLDDWQVSGVTTITSAQWGTATYSYTNVPRELSAFVGSTGGINAPGSRVHFTCDPNLPRGERTMERQFRTECVAPPTDALYLGDSVGDELHLANNNLGFINWDISLFKNVPLGGSRNLQLRVELYNAFNSDQWTGVDTSAQFDYLTGDQVDANFGTLTGSTRDARRIQLAARFTF